jgi:antitoxin component of RelBE/YafQ-DinJ toxin-antitoxin module
MPTIQVRTRIDRGLKKESDVVLKALGLDTGSLAFLKNQR